MTGINKKYDVLIAGAGIAGLYTALKLPETLKVLIIAKDNEDICSTSLAQGGVAAVMELQSDSYQLHFDDTMKAGRFANDKNAVKVLVEEGADRINDLIDNYSIIFDREYDGNLEKTLEGGHCRRRILHHADKTGAELESKLLKAIKSKTNIEFITNSTIINLKKLMNGFRTDILQKDGAFSAFSDFVVLATGGIGRIYQHTTNPITNTGDGIRLAYNLGATIKNLSYIQFHPTAFNGNDEEQFLISESVRGEGAYLLNSNKERFMHRYDERLELAPRDVVSRSEILESRVTGSDEFWLDIRYKGENYIKSRFPGIFAGCLKHGVDITKSLIPVFPCQHYLMGGIAVDLKSRTSVSRLYAVGECSNTGVHGKNRLASNSLLEALVFGKRAADDIYEKAKTLTEHIEVETTEFDLSGAPINNGIKQEIQKIMQNAYFVIPTEEAISPGLKRVDEILKRLQSGKFAITREYEETISLATIAHIILKEVSE